MSFSKGRMSLPHILQGRPKRDLLDYRLSGKLPQHSAMCEQCVGRGFVKGDDKLSVCVNCCGLGKIYWGGWFARELAVCNYCMKERVVDVFSNEKVCVRCYTSQHSQKCGCPLWAEVESELA